jgi:hypothetical protein
MICEENDVRPKRRERVKEIFFEYPSLSPFLLLFASIYLFG